MIAHLQSAARGEGAEDYDFKLFIRFQPVMKKILRTMILWLGPRRGGGLHSRRRSGDGLGQGSQELVTLLSFGFFHQVQYAIAMARRPLIRARDRPNLVRSVVFSLPLRLAGP